MAVRTFLIAGVLVSAMLLGGCVAVMGGGGSAERVSVQAGVSENFVPQDLFIADVSSNVLIYTANINKSNPPLLGEITQGVSRSTGVCIDRQGTLYVLNFGGSAVNVTEYKRGSSTPFKTITNGLDYPNSLTVDRYANLYVGQRASSGVVVVVAVYAKGASSPTRTIQVGGAGVAGGMAFDANGDLLVDVFDVKTNAAAVYSVAPGSSKAINLNLQNALGGSLGADRAGYIYVGDHEGNIAVYASGNSSIVRTINLNTGGFYAQIAVTAAGTIYWPNYQQGKMYEIAPAASGATNVFSTAVSGIAASVGPW
ncbi:MAG TPA: hypothetical protein VMT95_00020 [Candidatus Binatia bacterium]|nr:hypothetical protein [Candidatus Binatia bacterium]